MSRPWLILATTLLAASPSRAAELAVLTPSPLKVSYGGTLLIAGDQLSPDFQHPPEVSGGRVAGWDSVARLAWRDAGGKAYAEIAAAPGRVECTFVRLVRPDVAGVVRYGFLIPLEAMDGRRAEIVGQGVKVPAQFVGKKLIDGPLGPTAIAHVKQLRYLRLHHAAGAVDFDFHPQGHWTGETGVSARTADWSMRRTAAGYEFATAFGKAARGTLLEFKFVVRPADPRPVAEVHPPVANRWTDPYRNTLQLSFGERSVRRYIAAGAENSSARWRSPDRLFRQRDDRFAATDPIRHEGVCPLESEAENVLEIDVARDGDYLVNLLVGAADRAIGPCRIRPGNRPEVTCPAVEVGRYDSWSVVARSQEGRLVLAFRGSFRLVAAGVAPMLYENEDYQFRRTWWVTPGWQPDARLLD